MLTHTECPSCSKLYQIHKEVMGTMGECECGKCFIMREIPEVLPADDPRSNQLLLPAPQEASGPSWMFGPWWLVAGVMGIFGLVNSRVDPGWTKPYRCWRCGFLSKWLLRDHGKHGNCVKCGKKMGIIHAY